MYLLVMQGLQLKRHGHGRNGPKHVQQDSKSMLFIMLGAHNMQDCCDGIGACEVKLNMRRIATENEDTTELTLLAWS